MKTILIFLISLLSFKSWSSCQLTSVRKLNDTATALVERANLEKKNLPLLMQFGSGISTMKNSDDEKDFQYYHESIIRPQKNGVLSIPGFPIFGLRFRKNSDAVYLCAETKELTIYFMSGSRMTYKAITVFSGNPSLKVTPFDIVVVGPGQVPDIIDRVISKIPIIGQLWITRMLARLPTSAMRALQTSLVQTLSSFAGVGGVERVRITPEFIELAAQVDPDDPQQAGTIKRFEWDSIKSIQKKKPDETEDQ